METASLSKKHIINFGIVLGLLSVLMGVVMYVTNNHTEQNWMFSLIGFLIMLGVITYSFVAFKKANDGFMNLTEALKIGLGVALIGGLIAIIWIITLMTVIEPDMVNQIQEVQREQIMERYPDMKQEQLDQSLEIASKFSSPYILSAFALVQNLFLGFIISLISGLILQKKKDVF